MQKVNQNSQEKQLNEQLEDENRLLQTILQAHEETCDYTKEKVAPLVERARTQPVFAHCPPQMVSSIGFCKTNRSNVIQITLALNDLLINDLYSCFE